MLDLRDIFVFLLLITYSCTITAVDGQSTLIFPQIKHSKSHQYKNEKVILRNPFESDK